MSKKILIADVDHVWAAKCRYALRCCGYDVALVSTLDDMLEELYKAPPDLTIFGRLTAGLQPHEIYRVLSRMPGIQPRSILVHWHGSTETSSVSGIPAGAVLRDPLDASQLMEKTAGIAKPTKMSRKGLAPLSSGPLLLDPRTQAVLVGETEIMLSRVEFRVLHCLVRKFGSIVSRHELVSSVWGARLIRDSLLNAYVMKLRRKLARECTSRIEISTVSGAGYRLQYAAPAGKT